MSESLQGMRSRLNQHGGFPQQDRMIKDKRRSLDKAVLYSYQGAIIKKVGETTEARALINPNKLTTDYDNKILSVGFEYKFKPGDVFKWLNTGTYWLIYLHDLTELAYFRGDIRKCRFIISWKDDEGNICSTQAAIRGPVETRIESVEKNKISLDIPNHSLNILIPKEEKALEYFQRYSKFYLRDLAEGERDICWRVEGFDTISTPGIIEINAVEYYINETEDDLENGVAGGLIVAPIAPEPQSELIQGDNFIKPKITYTYNYIGDEESEWEIITDNESLQYKKEGRILKVKWPQSYSGEITLKYGSSERVIVITSLF